jgi:hypothetical protein
MQEPMFLVYGGPIPANADAPLGDNLLLAEFPLAISRRSDGAHVHGVDFATNATGTATFGRLVGADGSVACQIREGELALYLESGGRTWTIVCGMWLRTDFVLSLPDAPRNTSMAALNSALMAALGAA